MIVRLLAAELYLHGKFGLMDQGAVNIVIHTIYCIYLLHTKRLPTVWDKLNYIRNLFREYFIAENFRDISVKMSLLYLPLGISETLSPVQ